MLCLLLCRWKFWAYCDRMLDLDLQRGEQVNSYSLHDGYVFHGCALCIPDDSLLFLIMKEVHAPGHFGII